MSLLGLITEAQGRSCFRSASGLKAINYITEKSLFSAEDVSHCWTDGSPSSDNLPRFINSSTSGDLRPCASGEGYSCQGGMCVWDLRWGSDVLPRPSCLWRKSNKPALQGREGRPLFPTPSPAPPHPCVIGQYLQLHKVSLLKLGSGMYLRQH